MQRPRGFCKMSPAVQALLDRAKQLKAAAPAAPVVVAPVLKLTVQQERIVSCLAAGFKDSQIAESMGVTQSAISQEIEEYSLRELSAQRMVEKHSIFTRIDDKHNRIEDLALSQLEKVVPFITDPVKLCIIVRTANSAKRRSSQPVNSQQTTKVVQLNLPRHIHNTFVFNSNNEAIEVGGKALVSMSAATLLKKHEQDTKDASTDAEFQQIDQAHGSLLRHL